MKEKTLYKKTKIEEDAPSPIHKAMYEIGIPKDVVSKIMSDEDGVDNIIPVLDIGIIIEDSEASITDAVELALDSFDFDPVTPHENFLVGFIIGSILSGAKIRSDRNIEELVNLNNMK